MGLITKEIEVILNGKNIKHYKNLGYKIPKILNGQNRISTPMGTKIKVKVEDLPFRSNVKVDIQCDYCKKNINNIIYANYKKIVENKGVYYCKKCASKLNGLENKRLNQLKKSKSFEQWCIENNKQDILDRWDYELNDYLPVDILYKTNKKYYFKCSREIHKSELKKISDLTHKNIKLKCNICNSFAQWGIDNLGEDFLEKYWDYEKNTVSPWNIYSQYNKKVWIKCQAKDYHGSYNVSCSCFISQNHRCPYCSHQRIHPLDSLGTLYPEVLKIWSNKNNKSPYEYSPKSNQRVWWKCSDGKHKDYKRKISNSNIYQFKCIFCVKERDESFLQEKVRLYLNSLDYTILHEYNCTLKCINPKTNYQLPYDNEIKQLKLIIEIHGMQHYRITEFHLKQAKKRNTIPEYELRMTQVRDRYKRMYAKSQGYHYLEIPYWTNNKKETWKKMIDDKIKEIKQR